MLTLLLAAAHAGGGRVYVAPFQGGAVQAVDLEAGKVLFDVPVQDRSGSVGVASNRSGSCLYLVDGDALHRMRVIDAATGGELGRHAFDGRVQWLGEGSVLHRTADGRTLFVYTFDPERLAEGAAPVGTKLFDLRRGDWSEAPRLDGACAAPDLASASDGTVFARCGDKLHDLWVEPRAAVLDRGEPVVLPFAEVAGQAAAPNGSSFYALEAIRPGQPWRLAVWTRGAAAVQVLDLRTVLPEIKESPMFGGRAAIAMSPDGAALGLVHGTRAWILDPTSLALKHEVKLRWSVVGALFSVDGSELIAVQQGSPEPALVRIAVADGKVTTGPTVRGGPSGVALLAAAAAPAPEPAPVPAPAAASEPTPAPQP